MEIKLTNVLFSGWKEILKFFMKTFLLLCCSTILGFSNNTLFSQDAKVTIDSDKTVTIFEVFELIGKQTECTFIYQSDIFQDITEIHLKSGVIKVMTLLSQILPVKNFEINSDKNNLITISRKSSNRPQNTEIKGVIKVSNGMPIAGATIIVKGTNRGATSDFDGNYIVSANPDDILVISHLGYTTLNIPIQNRTTIDVILIEDATALGEVQINAGYYTTTDREKTGSIARITAKDIEKQPVNNPLEAMQGRMTGVDIVQTSGAAGSGYTVKIRGQNSIMAGNEPLYVIDGVPYDSKSFSYPNVSAQIIPMGNVSPLNAINPATIESIEVLKDADATAIYGSRGANGVILITTKKGKQGKTSFTIGSGTGVANIARKMDLMNTEQYLNMRREAFTNDGITNYPFNAYDVNSTWNPNRYTDWQKVLIGGTASTRNIETSVSGGNEQTQFLLSGMYQNETTVFPGDFNYDRININSNLQHNSTDKRFKLLFNVGYNIENNNLPMKDLSLDAIMLPPNAPPLFDENGSLNWENSTWTNPVARLQAPYKNKINGVLSNAVISFSPSPNLETKINLGYGNNKTDENYTSPHTIHNPAFGLNSSVSQLFRNNGENKYWITEPQIEWKKTFQKNKISILMGTTFQKNISEQEAFIGIGFPNNSFINNLSSANTVIILNEKETVYNYQSIYTRINYTFHNKVFLNATGRRDGSSRFGTGNKYGNFGALGAGYIFSEDLNVPWLSFGKLRASYGITGNDQIGDYQYLKTYVVSDYPYDGNIGLEPARLFNPHFKWEQNKKAEAALELKFLDNRIALSSAYYNNRSSNQLIHYALPNTTGFAFIQANLDALIENSGWEFELTAPFLRNNDFKWNASFNISLPKNKLLRFPRLENSTYVNRYIIGKPLSIVRLYKLNALNTDNGLFEFEDFNGDGIITSPEDKQYTADLTPKIYGGFSNSLSYKNWNLDVFFQFVKKKGYNTFFASNQPGTMYNQPTDVLDRWQQKGDNTSMQKFTTMNNPNYFQFSQSNMAVSDASFVRLKSAALSYTLPINKSNNTSCLISIQGQNLLTFTRFKGGDPEQNRGYLPPLRRVNLGVKLHL